MKLFEINFENNYIHFKLPWLFLYKQIGKLKCQTRPSILLLHYRSTLTWLPHVIFSVFKHKRSTCGMQFRKENNNQRNTFRRRLKGIQTSQHLFAFRTFVCLNSPCWVASETSTCERKKKQFSRNLFCDVTFWHIFTMCVTNQEMIDLMFSIDSYHIFARFVLLCCTSRLSDSYQLWKIIRYK